MITRVSGSIETMRTSKYQTFKLSGAPDSKCSLFFEIHPIGTFNQLCRVPPPSDHQTFCRGPQGRKMKKSASSFFWILSQMTSLSLKTSSPRTSHDLLLSHQIFPFCVSLSHLTFPSLNLFPLTSLFLNLFPLTSLFFHTLCPRTCRASSKIYLLTCFLTLTFPWHPLFHHS